MPAVGARIPVLAAFLVAATLALASTAESGVVNHRVAGGESLSSIAGDYYGDRDHYRLLALYNGIADPAQVPAGLGLNIPYSDLVTVRKGQSLSILAEKYLQDPSLFTVISRLNGLRTPENIAAGTRVRIPVLIPYTLHWGESLADIAREYYGDVRYYSLIADASGIRDPARVKAGTRLRLPFILIRQAGSAGKAKARSQAAVPARRPRSQVPAPAGGSGKASLGRLDRAESAYRRGEYEAARENASLALRGLVGSDRARGLRLLADISYAFGEKAGAAEYLMEAYRLDPGFTPQPAMYNPEMMDMHRQAKKKAE